MTRRYFRIAAIMLLTSAGSILVPDALAQDRSGGIHLGAVLLSPAIRDASVGYDSNVFNDPVNPRDDYTATFNPDVQVSMAAGRSRLTGNVGLNLVYFKQYVSQRSVGTSDGLRWEFAANRLRPYAAFSYSNRTNRPTPEINVRVRNKMKGASVGTQIRLTPRASLVFEGHRDRTTYDDAAQYLGNDLSQELDQTADMVSGSMWYDLTPLTKFKVTADVERQRYDTSGPRDARSYGLVSGVDFAPSALIRGGATFGYRHLNIKDSTVPDHAGFVMSVDLTYVLRGTTRFSMRADRDTAPSLVDLQPYYIQTGATAGISQLIAGALYVYASASRQHQDYQRSEKSTEGLFQPLSDASQSTLQAGTGWRVGPTTSISVYIESYRRRDGLYGNTKTMRIMTSLTYAM
jgi:Putative beta-barrel porin 2